MSKVKILNTKDEIPALSKELCIKLMEEIEKARKPVLEATKCSLDNAIYDPKLGFLVPGDKKVTTELNVSSVKKLTRALFILKILLRNVDQNMVNSRREIYYICKGETKSNPSLKPLDFTDQSECDEIIDFIAELLETMKESLNCFSNDRGGQTYSHSLVVTETLPSGKKAVVDLSGLGTTPFVPKNKPQDFKLTAKKGMKIKFCLIVESEGTANTLATNGWCERNPDTILVGAQGVPSNAVRSWVRMIQDQIGCPIYFFSDLDAYSIQNIVRVAKAGSANSLIRNEKFCAPEIRFLGILPEDIDRYGLFDYKVNRQDPGEYRAIKKAEDALANDPFFKDKKNKEIRKVLEWLVKEERRCEQQAIFGVDTKDPLKSEKIILEKIKKGWFIT